jgi:hypothetical protein
MACNDCESPERKALIDILPEMEGLPNDLGCRNANEVSGGGGQDCDCKKKEAIRSWSIVAILVILAYLILK